MPSGAFSMASMNWWPWMRGRKKLLGPSCSVSGVPKSQWSVKQTSVTPRLSSAPRHLRHARLAVGVKRAAAVYVVIGKEHKCYLS